MTAVFMEVVLVFGYHRWQYSGAWHVSIQATLGGSVKYEEA